MFSAHFENNPKPLFAQWRTQLTFLHGAKQVVEMLRRLVVVTLHLHAVIGTEQLGVLTVTHEVLIVELQVPHQQPVFFWFHGL